MRPEDHPVQFGEIAEQCPLLGEEGAPPRLRAGVLVPPDLQAEMLAGSSGRPSRLLSQASRTRAIHGAA